MPSSPQEPEALASTRSTSKPCPLSSTVEQDGLRQVGEAHTCPLGTAVLDDIRKGFLCDAEEGCSHFSRERVFLPVEFEAHGQGCPPLHLAGIPTQGRRQSQVIQVRRPQVGDHTLQFVERSRHQLFLLAQYF